MDLYVNDIYNYIWNTKARVIINYGGRDSGKSYFVGGQYFPIMMLKEKYFRGMVVKKTYTSCKDSVYKEITDGIKAIEHEQHFNNIQSPLEIRCSNGNTTIFRGLDNPTNLKSIKGLNYVWFEESEDLNEQEFDDLCLLLRGGTSQKIILTFNPIDQDHFTNRRYVECKKDRILETFEDGSPKVWEIDVSETIDGQLVKYTVLVICSTYNDNKFIEPVRKLTIEKLKDTNPFLYEVYRKGKFGTRGGRILENVEQIDFEEKGYRFENFDKKGYALDFGLTIIIAQIKLSEPINIGCTLIFIINVLTVET